jgi:isopentenyl diphosphate isomerase/L-lactate dehydrogenase-like FMN-dependent dehydrogenase
LRGTSDQYSAAPEFCWGQARNFEVDAESDEAYTYITIPDHVYVDEPYLSISWDSLHNHVYTQWRAFANSAELRAGLLKGIQAIREHSAAAYVSDARKVKVIVHEDQRWIKETWMPLAIQAGLKRIAFVTAATGLGKLTVEDVAGLVDDHGLRSHTFDSVAAARKWVSETSTNP